MRFVEANSDVEMLASILFLDEDGKHLLHGAAPSLPKAYNDAIHGREIGAAAGSCGTRINWRVAATNVPKRKSLPRMVNPAFET